MQVFRGLCFEGIDGILGLDQEIDLGEHKRGHHEPPVMVRDRGSHALVGRLRANEERDDGARIAHGDGQEVRYKA